MEMVLFLLLSMLKNKLCRTINRFSQWLKESGSNKKRYCFILHYDLFTYVFCISLASGVCFNELCRLIL